MNSKNQKSKSKNSQFKKENTSLSKVSKSEQAKSNSQSKGPNKKSETKKSISEKGKKMRASKKLGIKKSSRIAPIQKKSVKSKSEIDSESQLISKKSPNVTQIKTIKNSKEKNITKQRNVSSKSQKEEESKSSKLERSRDKSQNRKKDSKNKYKEEVIPTRHFASKDSNESNSENSQRKNSISQSSSQAKISYGSHSNSNSKGKDDSYKQEIKKMLKKVEDIKKAKDKDQKLTGKKRDRTETNLRRNTAKDYGGVLQKNPNFKREHLIDLNSLSKRQVITPSEIVLSLVEIAHNSDYYLLSYSNKSKMFWEDVLNYKLLGKIFNGLKGETLRKYWRILSKYDESKIKFVVEKHKKFFDSMNIRILTILIALSKYFENKIDDIEQYIKGQIVDVRKQEIYQEVVKDAETGLVKEIKDITTTSKRRRYEPGHKRQFIQNNLQDNELLDDIYSSGSKKVSKFQQLIKGLNQEKSVQLKFLKNLSEKEKKKIMNINEDDKFSFRVIDLVLDSLEKEFKNFTRDFILDTLIANSMDLIKTYRSLADEDEHIGFTSTDDKIILKMKGKKSYSNLIKEKGEKRVLEREEFLKN